MSRNPQMKSAVEHGRGGGNTSGGQIGSKKSAVLRGKKGSESSTQSRARRVAANRPQRKGE